MKKEIKYYNKDCIYISGSAQLPSGIPSGLMHEILNVGLMIDTRTGEIVDLSTTLLSEGATSFLKSIVVGFKVHETDVEVLLDEIRNRYYGDSQKAICVAVKRVHEKYKNLRR